MPRLNQSVRSSSTPSPRRAGSRWQCAAALAIVLGVWAAETFAAGVNAPPVADPRRLEPLYWREPTFFIPFQPDPQQFLAGSMREVRLLASRDGVAWDMLQRARPEVRGFSYRAPGDGEYYFAVQVEDSAGRLTPATISTPQLRVVVDGTRPTIKLEASAGIAGSTTLRYDVSDATLNPETLRIEVSESGRAWRSVQVGPPDMTRPDRLLGGVTWAPAETGAKLRFRVAIADRAGNTATAETGVGEPTRPSSPQGGTLGALVAAEAATPGASQFPFPSFDASAPAATSPATPAVQPTGPELEGPSFGAPGLSAPRQNSPAPVASGAEGPGLEGPALGPAASVAPLRGAEIPSLLMAGDRAGAAMPQLWPASNAPRSPAGLGSHSDFGQADLDMGDNNSLQANSSRPDRPAPPVDNPYAAPGRSAASGFDAGSSRLAAHPASSGGRTVYAADPFAASAEATVGEAASRPFNPLGSAASSPENPFAAVSGSSPLWLAAGAAPLGDLPPGTMLVNSRTFEVEYDVSTAGEWGVARVELWGTSDHGATWRSFAVDPDSRSPVRVAAPGGGLFGLRIVIHGANAAATPPPASGEKPEMYVYVDLHPPGVNLLGAERGQGDAAEMLRIRWSASDSNLAERPVTILYSSHETGPWSTAAANLENSGEFHWRLQRHLPERLFLRVEVRDQAGNIGFAELKNPVLLEAPQPVGRLRAVRPAG